MLTERMVQVERWCLTKAALELELVIKRVFGRTYLVVFVNLSILSVGTALTQSLSFIPVIEIQRGSGTLVLCKQARQRW